MQTWRFIIALAIFGAGLVAVDLATARRWGGALMADTVLPPAALVNLVDPFAGARDAVVGGVKMDRDVTQSQLTPRQVADRIERIHSEKLDAWRAARSRFAVFGLPSLLDDLTIPVRLDTPTWSLAGVIRAPDGFGDAGFASRRDLAGAGPTDKMVVVLAMRQPGGSIVDTMRFDGRQIAQATQAALPAALALLDGQTQLYELPDGAATNTLRLCDADIESAVARRMAALAMDGAEAEIAMRIPNQVTIFAEAQSWIATILISNDGQGGPAMELVQFQPTKPGGTQQ